MRAFQPGRVRYGRIRSTHLALAEGTGDDLQGLIYAGFKAPDEELNYPSFGITIEAGRITNTIIRVRDRSMRAVLDAAARLNTFLGVWATVDWGNRGIGWWCFLTSGTLAGVGGPFRQEGIEDALAGRDPTEVKGGTLLDPRT